MGIFFQIEVGDKCFTVTDKFSELFNQFIFDCHGQKDPMRVFSSWLIENQSLHTADELEVLSFCMSGVVRPLTPKQKSDTSDEKVRLQVFSFLNTSVEGDKKKTKQQAFLHVSELLHMEVESVEKMYRRAVKKFKSGRSHGRVDFIENVAGGFYVVRLKLKGEQKPY